MMDDLGSIADFLYNKTFDRDGSERAERMLLDRKYTTYDIWHHYEVARYVVEMFNERIAYCRVMVTDVVGVFVGASLQLVLEVTDFPRITVMHEELVRMEGIYDVRKETIFDINYSNMP
jgi:hypothetical protein